MQPRGESIKQPAVTDRAKGEPLVVIRAWAPWRLSDLWELWEFRDLLGILAWRDVSVRYKQTVLGVLWALLQPALQTLLFTILFHQVAGMRAAGDRPFVPFVLSGVVIWGLFSSGLSHASDSLVSNANLVTKVYFPRLIIPMASLFVSLIDFAFAASLLVVVMIYYRIVPTWQILLVIPLALQTLLTAAGAGMFLSVLNVKYRDIRYALPFFIQVTMYATPVFYSTDQLPARLRPLFELNPLAALIDGFRAALFGDPMPWQRLGFSLLLSVVLLAAGYLYFKFFERTLSDQI
jgi:lipopolysaccharide transport system permease protein